MSYQSIIAHAKSFVSHGFQSFVEIHNLMAMMHD